MVTVSTILHNDTHETIRSQTSADEDSSILGYYATL